MRVLVACEYSGRVRNAFRALGHDAWSCDILESEDNSQYHYQQDVTPLLGLGWDLMVCHPPCTHLSVSGAAHFPAKIADGRQQAALDFVQLLMDAPIPKICLENPISIISSKIRQPDQIIQPWQFGHGEVKSTCFWLKGLNPLIPTHRENGDFFLEEAPKERTPRVHFMPPSPDRWKERSRTFQGVANAMADQWG